MAETTCLVTVVAGDVYARFAEQLFASAENLFRPTERVWLVVLPGISGWPDATITRPRILAGWVGSDAAADCDYVFLIDADARFVEKVDPEILPRSEGITATLHPGYVGKPEAELPYERNPNSSCCVSEGEGEHYYCGGFVGGARRSFGRLMERSATLIDWAARDGRVPRWHDESALNRVLVTDPPDAVLSPAYCMPDDDSWYRSWWPEQYERRIVMLDKTDDQRGRR